MATDVTYITMRIARGITRGTEILVYLDNRFHSVMFEEIKSQPVVIDITPDAPNRTLITRDLEVITYTYKIKIKGVRRYPPGSNKKNTPDYTHDLLYQEHSSAGLPSHVREWKDLAEFVREQMGRVKRAVALRVLE